MKIPDWIQEGIELTKIVFLCILITVVSAVLAVLLLLANFFVLSIIGISGDIFMGGIGLIYAFLFLIVLVFEACCIFSFIKRIIFDKVCF